MTSETARSLTTEAASGQIRTEPIRFLDLPLEIRIQIYKEITTIPENYCIMDRDHPQQLPAIFRTHSQMTREIYRFCTVTAMIRHKIVWYGHGGIFSYLMSLWLQEIAKKLINFNSKPHHKGLVLNIMLSCSGRGCSEGEFCGSCKQYAEGEYILPLEEMGFERCLVTLV